MNKYIFFTILLGSKVEFCLIPLFADPANIFNIHLFFEFPHLFLADSGVFWIIIGFLVKLYEPISIDVGVGVDEMQTKEGGVGLDQILNKNGVLQIDVIHGNVEVDERGVFLKEL